MIRNIKDKSIKNTNKLDNINSSNSNNSSKENKIICKHCGNNNIRKYGKKNGEQRYYCINCHKTFYKREEDKRLKYDILLKKIAITFYLNGCSIRGIAKALNIIFNKKMDFSNIKFWIKNANKILEEEKERRKNKEDNFELNNKVKSIKVLEMDELFTFIKKKQKIQKEEGIMINEYVLLLIGTEIKLLHLK